MDIKVVSGTGTGKTLLSAFDAALKDAGVYNYNLIRLSSIIPPHNRVATMKRWKIPEDEYGHRLYIVMAEIRSDEAGKYIAAGLGWYQTHQDGRGIFVEHSLKGEIKAAVKSELKQKIKSSLRDLCGFRNVIFDPQKVKMMIALTKIEANCASALTIAVYKAESWD